MARRLRRKDIKKDEFVETALDFGQWLEDNWPKVLRWAASAVVVALLILFWSWYSGQEEKAIETLAQGVARYQQAEQGAFSSSADLEQALGLFEEAVGHSKRSSAGKTALFYQGTALYRLGRLDEAIAVLEEVRESNVPLTMKGLSGALLADVFVAAGQTDTAVGLLEEMAAAAEPAYPVDQTLLKLGRIYSGNGEHAEAQKIWRRIADEHPQTAGAMEANNLLNSPG